MSKDKPLAQSIREVLQEVSEEVCDNLCKYRETSDEDLICDYIRENGRRPLDRIN